MTANSKKLRFRIIVSSLLFCTIPMLGIAYYSYKIIEKDLIASNENHFQSVLQFKKGQITQFFQRTSHNIETIAHSPFVIKILEEKSEPLMDLTHQHINSFIQHRNIQEVIILDHHNQLILSSNTATPFIKQLRDFYSHCQTDHNLKSKVFYDKDRKIYYIFECHKVVSTSNKVIGTVVATIDVTPLFTLIQDYNGLGKTGETLLGAFDNKHLVFLNSLKHEKIEPLTKTILFDKHNPKIALPLAKGVSGENGSGVSTDYRGEKVIASWGFIPESSWGIVAKMDYDEAVESLNSFITGVVLASILFFIFSILFAWYIAYYLTAPIFKIENEASTDSLTTLPNRSALLKRLTEILHISKVEQLGFSILFLDLDGFKQINDSHGHEVGDDLLKSVAHRLSSVVQSKDCVARLGGDEFVVVLENISSADHVYKVAQRIRNKINEDFTIGYLTINVGVSIGVSSFPDDSIEIDTLLFLADKAMYAAKSLGKNNIQFATKL